MIPYVGDLSRNDAALLKELAEHAARILEFGAGASTQIFAAYSKGDVTSVETDPGWIDRTAQRVASLRASGTPARPVSFLRWRAHDGDVVLDGAFDLIFVDGIDELREAFALMVWPRLAIGGVMAFHDTRRVRPHGDATTSDVENVCEVVVRYSPEVESVVLNAADSNITLVTKRAPLPLEDWNAVEGRTPEQIGIA